MNDLLYNNLDAAVGRTAGSETWIGDKAFKKEEIPVFRVHSAPRVPHRCPICLGRGSVPSSFYEINSSSSSLNDVMCRSCWGSGIIWG